MFDNELFERIFNVTCPFEELEEFVIGIDKKEFDLDGPFEKYYSAETILSAIKQYELQQIDGKYLAYWMNAYNWIIMGGFQLGDEGVTLKSFLTEQISNTLDCLSFFDDSESWYNLEDYKSTFEVLDLALFDADNCEAMCAEHGDNEGEAVVLIANHGAKYFIRIYSDLDFTNQEVGFGQVEFSALEDEVNRLLSEGYEELTYAV